MTLPIIIPSTPSSLNILNSDDSKINLNNNDAVPRTPVSPLSPTHQQQQSQEHGQIKRKPSRRANTAERRATHNAVERQRRETLNGRFLDLAALLPNLSQIRRPSKSSIVNSSIAHIHASRRHRLLAARELRLLKQESDHLRREVNEWRDRGGIQRIEEPVRGDGFGIVLSAELEVIVGQDIMEEEDEDDYPSPQDVGRGSSQMGWDSAELDEYGLEMVDGQLTTLASVPAPAPPQPPVQAPIPLVANGMVDDARMLAMLKSQQQQQNNPYGPSIVAPIAVAPHANVISHPGPTNVPAFEALYEHVPPQLPSQQIQMLQQQYFQRQAQFQQQQQQQQQQHEQEKMWGLYNPNPRITQYSGQQQQQFQQSQAQFQQQMMLQQAQRTLFTPPSPSHGLPTPSPTVSNNSLSLNGLTNNTNTNTNTNTNNPSAPPSPPSSDHGHYSHHIPVILGNGNRQRSGSVHSHHSAVSTSSHHSSSSQRGSLSPSYELGMGLGVDFLGIQIPVSVGNVEAEYAKAMGVPRMMGDMQLASPVSAVGSGGGGGSGGIFAMMM